MNTQPRHHFYHQLEGLRGVAVLLVVVSHFVIIKSFPKLSYLNLGFWGVNIFFVLSGFLISEILMRDAILTANKKKIFQRFYLKRFLRIFPIYYLSIFVLLIVGVIAFGYDLLWALTYTLNIKEIWFGQVQEIMKHLWSLCVEEQFYLFWPLLIVLVPRFRHLPMILLVVLAAVLLRFVFGFWKLGHYVEFNHAAVFTSMDALGLGALLAYLKSSYRELLVRILRWYQLPLITAIFFMGISFFEGEVPWVMQTFGRLLCAITAFFLVGWGALDIQNGWSRLMVAKPLQKVGKISYGVYLYHWFIYVLFAASFTGWWKELIAGKMDFLYYNAWFITFLVMTALTLMVAWLSFRFIESPLLKLKHKIG